MIELDIILALLNRADKLHAAASRLFEKIISGELSNVSIPASAYLEYELVMRSRGYSSREIADDVISLRSIPGLGEVPLTSSVLLSASGCGRLMGSRTSTLSTHHRRSTTMEL